MSYILDALKKADAERERNAVPGLHAQAGAGADDEGRRTGSASKWLVGAALVMGAALAVWWWVGRASVPEVALPMGANAPAAVVSPPVQSGTPTVAVPAPVMVPPPAPVAVPAPAAITQTVAPPTVFVPPPAATPPPPPAPVAAPATTAATAAAASAVDGRIPQLAELSPEVRRQLPPLAVGGSVYSAKPASRMVILNGQVLREGDSVADGLVVERIGLKGSILSLRGTRFEIKH